MPFRTAAAGQAAAAAIGRGPTHLRGSAGGSRNNSGTGGTGAAGAAGSGSEDGEEAGGEAAGRKGGRGRGRGRGGGGSRGGSRGAGGSGSGGSSPEYRVSGEDEEVLAADLQEEEEGMSGGEGGGRGAAARRKQVGEDAQSCPGWCALYRGAPCCRQAASACVSCVLNSGQGELGSCAVRLHMWLIVHVRRWAGPAAWCGLDDCHAAVHPAHKVVHWKPTGTVHWVARSSETRVLGASVMHHHPCPSCPLG